MRTKSVRSLGMMGVVCVGSWTLLAQAEELAVPGEYATIQSALNAAVDGDEVVVSPGTYFESIDLLGKEVTLRSVDPLDPKIVASTILDGTNEPDSIVNCDSGETLSTVIDGLTFTNGIATLGGAIDLRDGGLTIRRCVFEGNRSSGSFESTGGGAVSSRASDVEIIECQFIDNQAWGDGSGGSINTLWGTLVVRDCTFVDGGAFDFGGHVSHWGDRVVIRSSSFSGGSAYEGGAISFGGNSGSRWIIDCLFQGNEAEGFGGAFGNWSSPVTIVNSRFIDNSAEFGGAVAQASNATECLMVNCLLTGNSAQYSGGGCCVQSRSEVTLSNCSLVGNTAPIGGAISSDRRYEPGFYVVQNSILWENGAIPISGASGVTAYSNVEGGTVGEGNIDANPMFVDADGPDDVFGTEDDDLRLAEGSPSIDAGGDALLADDVVDLDGDDDFSEFIPFDFAMSTRVTDGDGDGEATVDMGAFESPALIPACAADLDGSGVVDVADLLSMLAFWGACDGCSADLNGDAVVDTTDLLFLLATWGECG